LADILVQVTLDLCWCKLKKRHREKPRFAVIGYGKLGGKELGYASDLDIVFLYDDADPEASELYTRLGQRINTWLSSRTSAGILFEADLRLRPNGDSGILVPSVDSFRDYQLKNAWVWEHQALTRARFCAGDPFVGGQFEAIRIEILRQQRDISKLKEEVLAMRQRMRDNHASKNENEFDIKQDEGGIIDVEFIVQYLVLGHAHAYPELCSNLGNIALLGIAAELGLIPLELADEVRNAYREYRRMQHANRIDGRPSAGIDKTLISERIGKVRALWKVVFE
jgi:glutamate-ammonia-ligase adenylyltransferase